MIKRATRAIGAATCLLTLANCASVVSDNDSATYVETVPEKARCELHGQDFTRVINTPNSIQLPSSAAPITVACAAEGHKNTTASLDTSMDGWILGNLIFGGIIGVAIDAARGAGMKYPPRVTVVLEPEAFPTASARDLWYDSRRKQITEKWSRIVDGIRSGCSNQPQSGRDCGDETNKAEKSRDTELQELEVRRIKAVVRGV